MTVRYLHPVCDDQGRRLSSANIIWAERDGGSAYYRTSKFAMQAGKFPPTHPCAPFDDEPPKDGSQMGGSKALTAFRARGYWASCFPEGDGITLQWWDGTKDLAKTAEEVMQDIRECFGWEVVDGRRSR
jgi:hypothetical protein